MSRMEPKRLLFILLGAVPLVVLGGAVASVVLLRAGYGVLVWALLPFLGVLLVAVVLGLVLGRAAGRHPGKGGPGNDNPRERNDV